MDRAPSFRRHTRRISLAGLFLAYPLVATAVADNPATQSTLEGWGQYKCGTPVTTVNPGEGRELLPGKGGLDLLDSTRIGGQLYTVELYFRGVAKKLFKIQLHAEELAKMDQGGCRGFFEKI